VFRLEAVREDLNFYPWRIKQNMKSQKGFSLVELLVVVIIIAIVAAIAIPNLLASRRAANEASAISSLRTIHSAEVTYFSTTGGNSTYAVMGPVGTAGSLAAGGLIDDTLGGGTKSGYSFATTLSTGAPAGSQYCATAWPTTLGSTGNRDFGVSSNGVIVAAAATAAHAVTCTAATGALAGTGVAIQ
jgi:prepilin-type N-terminal cleavage/methylation domain-containing protein